MPWSSFTVYKIIKHKHFIEPHWCTSFYDNIEHLVFTGLSTLICVWKLSQTNTEFGVSSFQNLMEEEDIFTTCFWRFTHAVGNIGFGVERHRQGRGINKYWVRLKLFVLVFLWNLLTRLKHYMNMTFILYRAKLSLLLTLLVRTKSVVQHKCKLISFQGTLF